ncbi:MAG TPA: hypothetical protein VN956_19770 [Pyrinomonadaceae bacterium]|nr:hypothetical protein [Pyrinomonadaceae bacterium]
MKDIYKHLLLIVSAVVLLSCAPEVRACSCAGTQPACEEFGSAKAVFIGKVIGAKQHRQERDENGSMTTYDVGEIFFKVEDSFLGVKSTRAVIHSGTGGGDCGYWFRRGERYLVYAYGESLETLGTNICTRTRLLADANEDLEFLRNLPRKGTGARIYGAVAAALKDPKSTDWRTPKPLEGVIVKIEGPRRTFDAMTDSGGQYEITGVPAGKYKVHAIVPDYYRQDQYWIREIELNDRGCAREDFFAQNDSRITGHVFKPDGTAMAKAHVELMPLERNAIQRLSGDETWADEKGEYELEKIPAGRYLLGINLSSSPDDEQPYPRTFYPGVTDRSRATVIEIGLGQKLKDIDIHLPQQAIAYLVRGFVVWPDGSLAKAVDIYLEDVDYLGWCVNGCAGKTDEQGRFELKGFAGYKYRVVSTAERPSAEGKEKLNVYGVSESFQLGGEMENLRIMLSLPGRPSDKKEEKSKER